VIGTISREELKRKIDNEEQFTLVETLAPHVFEHAHLPGAINLPPDLVKDLAPTVLPDKAAEIVVYCTSFT
jgi:rhodanese-related sulfurtransferase